MTCGKCNDLAKCCAAVAYDKLPPTCGLFAKLKSALRGGRQD